MWLETSDKIDSFRVTLLRFSLISVSVYRYTLCLEEKKFEEKIDCAIIFFLFMGALQLFSTKPISDNCVTKIA